MIINFDEIKNKDLKREILVGLIVEEAQKRMSYYRQRQDDLIARMSTEWPNWGANIDFFTHFVYPLLTNPLCIHFINKSENYDLKNNYIRFGVFEGGVINYFEPRPQASLRDFAVNLIRMSNNPKYKYKGKFFSAFFSDSFLSFENQKQCLVNVRDGVIGAKAFTSFLEGIMRNASKHGVKNESFITKIVFCNDFESVKELVELKSDYGHCLSENQNYRYIIISINIDMVYDSAPNKKEKRRVDSSVLSEMLLKRFESEIVDNKGMLKTGYWGLKEIKINAAFTAYEPLKSVNEKTLKYLFVGETKNTDAKNNIWSDGSRIAYVLRLNAPRQVCAVFPQKDVESHQSNLAHWHIEGVKIITYEPESFAVDEIKKKILKENLDYEILYIHISDQSGSELFQGINGQRKVPQRLYFNNNINLNYMSMDFVLRIYEGWLKSLMKSDITYKLIIYFDDKTMAKKWNDAIQDSAPNNYLFSFPESKQEDESKENILTMHFNRHEKLNNRYKLYHRARLKMKGDETKHPYYYQHVSGADSFFSLLMSVDPESDKTAAKLMLLKTLESALLNVLIIDERIAQALLKLKANEEPEVSLVNKLYWMGIDIAKFTMLNDKVMWGIPRTDNDEDAYQMMVSASFSLNNNDNSTLSFCSHEDEADKDNGKFIKHDFLFIHATRLSEIAKNMSMTPEDLVNKLKDKHFRFLIVHSGRGKTDDIPSNAIFMEYSILEQFVLYEPSKFYLIQQALSIKV